MKKIENSFVVSGFVGKDASIHQFSTASVARFSLAISRTEKNGEETNRTSAFMNVEAWRKNENTSSFDRLVKGTLLTVEGYFKPERNGRMPMELSTTVWFSSQPSSTKLWRKKKLLLHRRARQRRANNPSRHQRVAFGSLFFVFWALFFLTEPYKFALYPTFSLPLCIYFKNIA